MELNISKIKDFFRYDPSSANKRERDPDIRTNMYYERVSYRYGYAAKILCVLLALIMLVFVFSGSISYDKFYYLVKDFGIAADFVSSNYRTITYGVGNSQSYALYHGGLAVASREGISLYTAGGGEMLSLTHQYGNPVIISSSKYALLYDLGGKQYSLYNSFSKTYEEKLDYPIYHAVIADTGEYAIVTSSKDYRSVLRVYDKNGKRYDYNFSSSYIYSVAMSSDASRIAVALSEGNGEGFASEIRLYSVGRSDYKSAKLSFSSAPLEIGFFENGNLCAVGRDGVNVFNRNLKLDEKYDAERSVYAYSVSEDGVALAYLEDNGSSSRVVVLDKRGKEKYSEKTLGKVLDLAIYEKYLFLQTPSGFARINTGKPGQREDISLVSSDFSMLVSDSKTILICNSSYARYVKF